MILLVLLFVSAASGFMGYSIGWHSGFCDCSEIHDQAFADRVSRLLGRK